MAVDAQTKTIAPMEPTPCGYESNHDRRGIMGSKERNQDKTRHIGLGTDLAQSALVLANIRTRINCNQLVINHLL